MIGTIAAVAIGVIVKKSTPKVKLSSNEIHYTQDSIRSTWGRATDHAGQSIYNTLHDLQNGTINVKNIPAITVIKHNRNWYSLDNRRLYVFKMLGADIVCKKSEDSLPGRKIYGGVTMRVR